MKKNFTSVWYWGGGALVVLALSLVLSSCGGGGGGSDDEGLASTPSGSSGSNTVSAGFVAVQDGTVTGGSKFTLAGQTADYYKGVFVAGRTVTLSSFYICDHEVTQAEYQAVMGYNPSYFSSSPASGETQAKRPVEKVSWYDAIMYCNERSKNENLTPCYKVNGKDDTSQWGYTPHGGNGISGEITCNFSANGYRLPTEAEWEYAARGGAYGCSAADPDDYAGTDASSSLGDYAWYYENSENKTHEVMKKLPNSLDLYDMSGNVFEWCWDWYDTIATGSVTNPTGGSSGSCRVSRGGGYYNVAGVCSVAYRGNSSLILRNRYDFLGFRVVRTAD